MKENVRDHLIEVDVRIRSTAWETEQNESRVYQKNENCLKRAQIVGLQGERCIAKEYDKSAQRSEDGDRNKDHGRCVGLIS